MLSNVWLSTLLLLATTAQAIQSSGFAASCRDERLQYCEDCVVYPKSGPLLVAKYRNSSGDYISARVNLNSCISNKHGTLVYSPKQVPIIHMLKVPLRSKAC